MYGNMGAGRARNAKKGRKDSDVQKSHFHKDAFANLQKAREAAEFWNGQTPLRFSYLEPYRCRYCPHYHIGHGPEGERQGEREPEREPQRAP